MADEKAALLYAVKQGENEKAIRALIDAGHADVNMTNEYGMTALLYAVQVKRENVVRALLDAGADANTAGKDMRTALVYALQQVNNEGVFRALIDAGAEVNMTGENGKTALLYILQQGKKESVVRALLDVGADVNMADDHGLTSLFYAVQHSNNDSVVRLLIDAGADVNMTNADKRTALFYAVYPSNNESVVRLLIKAGADVNMIDKYGTTALFYAVKQYQNESVVRALISAGADVHMSSKEGKTLLFYAVQQSPNDAVVRELMEKVDLTVRDKYGRTAHFYVSLEDSSSLNCLLEGGNVNPYLKLEDNCNVDIVSFLIERWLRSELRYDPEYDIASRFNVFKKAVLDVFARHGMKRESFIKAIVNVLFLEAFFFKTKHAKHPFLYADMAKCTQLEKLYCKYISRDQDSLQKEARMQTVCDALNTYLYVPNLPEALKSLVDLDADPDSADSDGNTVLHHTTRLPLTGEAQEKVMDLCKLLKRLGAQPNKRNQQGQTALLFCLSADMAKLEDKALQSAAKTLVQVSLFLVKEGSSMNEISKSGESVFHLIIKFFDRCLKVKDEAVRKDVLTEANKLLQLLPSWKIADENIINMPDVHLNTPLHLWGSLSLPSRADYIRSGEDHTFKELLNEILKCFLECGAKVNFRNENDETPLHLCKTWTAVKLLLDARAKPNDVDSSGRLPLLAAAGNHIFLKHAANFYPDVREEPKKFWKAAVQMGLDPWTVDNNDESVLSILVESENFVLSKALVDVACEEGYTKSENIAVPLLNAICKDSSTRTYWKKILVQDILKSRKCSTTASTPLRHCCRNILETGVLDKMKSSIQSKGLDKESTDKTLATRQEERGETGKLQTSSAEYNQSVHCEIADLLRSYGADIATPDSSGKSCLDIAERHPALKDFLTKPIDRNAIPVVIPWTSTSTKYEDRMARVARQQECEMVDQIWYHEDPIGSGSFGDIFAGINEKDGREVAIKRIVKLRMQRPEDKREIKHLATLADCKQVVGYLSFFEDGHFSYIVLELMEGNLEEYLSGSKTDATQATLLCKDVIMGLKFLHKEKVLHRDLKPQNILYKVHPKLCLKIADFGLSRIIDSVSTTAYGTHAGTRCWIAPEVLKSKTNTFDKNCFEPASDMFSCGLILHYILSGRKHPFIPTDWSKKSEPQVAIETEANLINGRMEGWDDTLSPEATAMVQRMLESNEKSRPSAEKALEHPLFWSNEKKKDFLKAIGNQQEFECPRSKKASALTPVEIDLEKSFSTLVKNGKCNWPWNDPGYLHMPDIYTEMTRGKGRKKYDTSSAVELVRFIRNVYEHYKEKTFVFSTAAATTTPITIEHLLFKDFEFLEYFPHLVMEVYKAVTTYGWDQTRDDIQSTMNKN